MRHGVKQYSFSGGIDANQMLLRKLAVNFLEKGTLTTTETKAKFAKSYLDRIIEKAKERNEANKNFIMRSIIHIRLINYLFDEVGPSVKDVKGGFIKIIKLGVRSSDGARKAKLVWAHPVVKEKEVTTVQS